MSFRVVGDETFAETVAQRVANRANRKTRRKLKEEAFRRAAAGDEQASSIETCARHHDARADINAASHPVGLRGHFACDAKRLASDTDGIADFRVQAEQHP